MHNAPRFRMVLLNVAALASASATMPAWARIQAGDHIPITVKTPTDYKGIETDEPVLVWRYELSHPEATFIAIHFADFDLGRGDYLIVSDPVGEQFYTMEGRGKMGAGTFWAQHIKGDTAVLELMQLSKNGGRGFRIDEYVAGFLDLGGGRAICGTDDKENAVCYQTSHPTQYDRGRAVARLLIGGSGLCTGWLVSGDNHLMTNDHCIGSASDALNTDYEFMAEAPNCGDGNCQLCYPGDVFSGGTFVVGSSNLDFTLVQVNAGDPAALYGFLEIDNRVAVPGEQIYILQHPGGRAKEFAIFSTDPHDPGGNPVVNSITAPPCNGTGFYDVGYYADTEGGSSGSPVLATSSHKVIALHHCANCPNRGVPINLIHPLIEQYLLPGPAGTVTFDRASYSCSDNVALELRDGDLQNAGTHNVTVTSSGGDVETVTLAEIGPNMAIFTGNIPTGNGAGASEDGTLQVAPGDIITVTYIDADDGQGNTNVTVTDNATIDCTAPVISDVQTIDLQPRSATVQITADENIRGTVHYGLACGSLTSSASGSGFANPATVEVTGLQDNTPYYYAAEAADEAGNSDYDDNGGACYTFTTPDIPDYFTEQFGSDNDLDYLSLAFTPNGSVDFYAGCVEVIAGLPTDPTGGTVISSWSGSSDDGFVAVNLSGGATVELYGVTYSTFYVGTNGYITFTAGDSDYTETPEDHFALPRIAALFDDLNPGSGGTVSYKELADRVALTYENVPEYANTGSNTFQVEMYFDGTIAISYLNLDAADGLAGLSAGAGVPADFYGTDLSGLGPCVPTPPTAYPANYSTAYSSPLSIALQAQDDGLPDPPGALTYIITALPAETLRDAGDGHTLSPGELPYTLVGGGNQVIYQPGPGFLGVDSFEFKVNDGGVPPEGGDSNTALVAVDVVLLPWLQYSFPMDTDPGWATEGQWAFGQPTGGGSHDRDPTGGHTGDNVYGYNLNGDYSNGIPVYYLTSPAIDCRNLTAVELRFWKWLGVEAFPFDHAGVQVSNNASDWVTVWQNDSGDVSDSAWSRMVFDVSAVADGQPTVYFRWGMGPSDGGVTFPGWNIDDVEVWAYAPLCGEALGDFDSDCDVDLSDFATFANCYHGQSVTVPPPSCTQTEFEACDLDDDSDVDLADFSTFANNYTG